MREYFYMYLGEFWQAPTVMDYHPKSL